jgi:peptidoglycan/xylan/chitin deacetylase (PgdA/CDA1 family)
MNPTNCPIILTYHSICRGQSPTQVSPSLFVEQMEWLHDNVRVAPLREVVSALVQRVAWPERTVVLTFDDGYQNFYSRAAPVLRRLKLPATIFLPTGFCAALDRRTEKNSWNPESSMLDWGQVTDLSREGFEIGAHSVSHSDLTALATEDARSEIRNSKVELEKRTGRKADFFAYPYGRWSDAVRAMVKQEYRGACSTGAGVVQPDADPLALPRVDAHYLRHPSTLRMIFTSRFLAYIATRRFIRRMRRQPEGIYATV